MYSLFLYNWQVRDEWFAVLKDVPNEELTAERTGGVGSILRTLFHILDVEYSWIRGIEGYDDPEPLFEDYSTIELIQQLSDDYRKDLKPLLDKVTDEREQMIVKVPWDVNTYQYGEVLRHVIAHEIHHIGQLSVWAKETGVERVSANFIGRGLGKKIP
ncbi:DinB family protein [Paenibacillus dakarensis]|uniref:DinB family protein n=1 Tax=Paenibacillus dakarensis TaxID=1527293 RepID=UPI0006D53127|nr:DinB family protein [Paenibacillus dakarensis]